MRAKSREAGVAWRKGEVAAIETEGDRVRGLVLADGMRIEAGRVIVCAGCDTPPFSHHASTFACGGASA